MSGDEVGEKDGHNGDKKAVEGGTERMVSMGVGMIGARA